METDERKKEAFSIKREEAGYRGGEASATLDKELSKGSWAIDGQVD